MINIEEIDKRQVEICLNCQLPDCQENSEGCLLYHPEREDNMGKGKVGLYLEENKEAIINDYKQIGWKRTYLKWDVSQSCLTSYLKKWGVTTSIRTDNQHNQTPELVHQDIDQGGNNHIDVGKTVIIDTTPVIEVDIIEKMLEMHTIDDARAFWGGVKAARGIM